MGIAQAKLHLKKWGKDTQVIELAVSSATVELAAAALGVSAPEIAKSISLYDKTDGVILIIAAGHRKIDSRKFKDEFGLKAKMLAAEDVEPLVGHPIGGVCPFGVKAGVHIFLDRSLQQFDAVYPACGTANSAIKLAIAELEEISGSEKWVDVTKE